MLERMANFQTETSKKISHKFQKRTSMALEEIDVKMGENKIETEKNTKRSWICKIETDFAR